VSDRLETELISSLVHTPCTKFDQNPLSSFGGGPCGRQAGRIYLDIRRSFHVFRTKTAQKQADSMVHRVFHTDRSVCSHTAFTLHYPPNFSRFCYRNTFTTPADRRRKLINHSSIGEHASHTVSNLLIVHSLVPEKANQSDWLRVTYAPVRPNWVARHWRSHYHRKRGKNLAFLQ
jgi:hypothetical protein